MQLLKADFMPLKTGQESIESFPRFFLLGAPFPALAALLIPKGKGKSTSKPYSDISTPKGITYGRKKSFLRNFLVFSSLRKISKVSIRGFIPIREPLHRQHVAKTVFGGRLGIACRVWYELLVPTTAEIAADSISGKFPSGNGTPFRQQIQRTKRNAFLPLLPLLGLFKERQTYEQTTYPRVPSRRMRIPWPLLFMAARLPRSRSKLVELEPALLGSAQAWKEFAPGLAERTLAYTARNLSKPDKVW
ncbi:hypothetical protein SLEP1_g59117 [Rubroshorea leprosula]|uniref:Uncharacterized protein n=1 Tax=Rubroshorea leprosula TaxID=152421 RepID=A0AAV5MU77_9ROSI|nr:hypothetical protein SLEP1_g59117 [Rubroshorea leprosula]